MKKKKLNWRKKQIKLVEKKIVSAKNEICGAKNVFKIYGQEQNFIQRIKFR